MYGCAATFAGVWIIAWVPTPNKPSTGPNGASNDTETDGYGLFVPDCTHPGGGVSRKPGNVPVLKSRRSTVSLVGISPAQVRAHFFPQRTNTYTLTRFTAPHIGSHATAT